VAKPWHVLNCRFVQKHRNGIEVAGERICTDAKGLERDRPAAGEGIDDEGLTCCIPAQRNVRGMR
jgi:hypothetical protein